ncbi:hypothetical protein [Myxococcus phage Mx1]|nr:hypothetical protein [Myxococcus phage Mx1]
MTLTNARKNCLRYFAALALQDKEAKKKALAALPYVQERVKVACFQMGLLVQMGWSYGASTYELSPSGQKIVAEMNANA